MKLSKSLLFIPAASFLFAVAVGSGACGATVTTGAPGGFVGATGAFALGADCSGEVYFSIDGAYEACEDGVWAYEDAIPTGYEVDSSYSGDDSGAGDDTGTGDDSGTATIPAPATTAARPRTAAATTAAAAATTAAAAVTTAAAAAATTAAAAAARATTAADRAS